MGTIRITWHKPDDTSSTVEVPINPHDPNRANHDVQLNKARSAAAVYFQQKYGLAPMPYQLAAQVIGD
jgi:hypothetical protein